MARRKPVREGSDLQERVVFIHRVSKVVKGGRRFSLAALVVVGDGNGKVGLGYGKSAEVPGAISKAKEAAKKNMFQVPVTSDGSIPHQTIGHYGAGRVLLQPAVEGTGVIAGGPVRPLFELAGIKNILSKSLGTNNAMNVIKAAAIGLQQLESPKQTAHRRGMSVADMFGIKPAHTKDANAAEKANDTTDKGAKTKKAAQSEATSAGDKAKAGAAKTAPSAKESRPGAKKEGDTGAKKPGVKANTRVSDTKVAAGVKASGDKEGKSAASRSKKETK